MLSTSSRRPRAPLSSRRPSRLVALTLVSAICAVPSLASAQSVINNWKGESGRFGDATKWFDEIVPTATQITVIASGNANSNTTATIEAGDAFVVREVNVGNGEFEFAGAVSQVGDGTLNQTGGTITSNDWFSIGRRGDPLSSGTYNFSGGVANKGGGGLFIVNAENAGASVVNMSGNAIFNNTGTGDTRIGAGAAGGTLNMSGTSQLNHTQAEFKVGDFFNSVGNLTMTDASVVTVNNRAVFLGIFGGDANVTMSGSSKILKTGAGGQFAITDSFFQGGDSTNAVVTMRDDALIDIAQGSAGIDGEFWVGQGFNGTGTLNMEGNARVVARNQIMVGRSAANGTINLGGNASIVLDGAFSAFSVGNFDQGKGVVNQTGGTLDIRTGFLRVGDGFDDLAPGASGRLAQRSDYNLSGGIAHFGVGMDVGAFGDADALVNVSGGAADANFMFLSHPAHRASAELRVSGGSLTINGDAVMGASQNPNATAVANLTGGVFRQTGAAGQIIVGDQGIATINLSAAGRLDAAGFLLLGLRNASETTGTTTVTTGTGIINLNGGTLAAASLRKGLGNATVNFNGGTLQAVADEADFIRNFATADLNAGAGHAVIDSNGFNVSTTAAIGGAGGLTKRGAGRLELTSVQQYAGRTRIEAGTLRTNATSGVSRVTALEFAGTAAAPVGTLDIAGKPLVIDYAATTDLNAIRQAAAAGVAAGSTGGIVSAGAPGNEGVGYADPASLTSVPAIFGTVDATSVLLRQTYKGDTNLDGTVAFADLVSLAQSYGQSDKFWVNGDSTYDGVVDFADLVPLAQNYGLTLTGPQVALLGASFAADFALAQLVAVPEPTTLGLLAGASALALGRRRTPR